MKVDMILAWIEGRLSKIRSRMNELNEKEFLHKLEDREYGKLREKEKLLEELKDFIEGEKENEKLIPDQGLSLTPK